MKKLLLFLLCLVIFTGCSKIPEVDPTIEPTIEVTPLPEPPEALTAALDAAPVLTGGGPALRKFPYPYRAMLAITSDCDSTTTDTFTRVHRFLNTFEETEYGPGLGLDISDSFFMYNGSDYDTADGLMSFCEGTDPDCPKDAELIKKYYDCGWIDSIHAFGDFSNSGGSRFTRALALRAWEKLDKAGIAPSVWIDHGTYTNVQNFGAYNPHNASSYQAGDDPDSIFYHTDITLAHSIRYVWYSRHSDIFGRDYPLEIRELRDGRTVWSFARYTSEMIGQEIDWTWRPNRLHDQITKERLDALEMNGQYCIIAQHITVFQPEEQFGEADLAALRMLAARFHDDKSILVARTSRLLDYALAWKHLTFQTAEAEGFTGIRILSVTDPVGGERKPTLEDLAGITFYCTDPERTAVFLGDRLLTAEEVSINPPDETGRPSISIPWFSADTTDYTKSA